MDIKGAPHETESGTHVDPHETESGTHVDPHETKSDTHVANKIKMYWHRFPGLV